MGAAHRAFVAADTMPRDPAWVAAALGAAFVVETEPRSSSRTVWLDTADWRLDRAGLTLSERGRGARRELVLDDATNAVVAPASGTTWPALLPQLPGFLQARLAPVIGVRAVLAMAEVEARSCHWRLLDEQGKTVVWLSVADSRLIRPRAAVLPLRITLDAVRGYQPQLKRAAALLLAVPEVAGATGSERAAELDAAGHAPRRRTGNLDVALDTGAPVSRSVAAILLRTTDSMQRNLAGILADVDTEFLHDFRIAVRQTRTVLKTTAGALPDEVGRRFSADWRWLGQVTAPVRDLDVALLGILAPSAEPDEPLGLQPLREHLARLRRSEFRRLRIALAGPRLNSMLSDWTAVLTAISDSNAVGQQSTADLAAERIRRWQRRVAKRGRSLTAEPDPQSLHDLRKRCKELRYVSEAFASLPCGHRKLTKALKHLQDVLGEIQDAQVHRDLLTRFATATKPTPEPATLLAVGALIERLDSSQRRAIAALPEALDRFGAAVDSRPHAMARP